MTTWISDVRGIDCADAHLIAAAPDLLEACKALPIEWLDSGVIMDPRADHVRIRLEIIGTTYEAEMTVGQLRAVSAAIAKATGSACATGGAA